MESKENEGVLEMKVSVQKPVSFFRKAAANFLQGTDDKPPVPELRILALGNAIPVAAIVANCVSQDGFGRIVRVSTAYPDMNSGKGGRTHGCPQLIVEIKNSKPPPLERVIFLDVDGVLHPWDSVNGSFKLYKGCDWFLPSCMQRLHDIVKGSSASIVLSSSWRQSENTIQKVNDELRRVGLDPVVDCTPVSRAGTSVNFQSRSEEILDWLSRHQSVKHFVTLDDCDLSETDGEVVFGKHCVQTPGSGIEDADVTKALQVLQLSVDRSSLLI